MAISTTPPKPGTYNHVLRRYDRDPTIAWPLNAYHEVVQSLDIEMYGVRAPTLFVREQTSVDFANLNRNGAWKDETTRWEAHLDDKADPAAPPPRPAPPPEPEHPALTEEEISGFSWNKLQTEAALRGVVVFGKNREAITADLLTLYPVLAAA